MTYLDALQTTLAAEHAAVFVAGYLGAQTSQSAEATLYATLRESYVVHRARRDELVERVRDAGGEPVAAEASYELPDVTADGRTAIQARGLQLERDCGATYGYLAAHSPRERRQWAVDALLDAAVRELALGGEPRVFPGR